MHSLWMSAENVTTLCRFYKISVGYPSELQISLEAEAVKFFFLLLLFWVITLTMFNGMQQL